jgi:hypothetical protein
MTIAAEPEKPDFKDLFKIVLKSTSLGLSLLLSLDIEKISDK